MNTAKITGPHAAIYGIGPSVAALVTERFPFVSDFVRDVGRAGMGMSVYGISGGTYGNTSRDRFIVGGYADARVLRAGCNRAQAQSAALLFADENRSKLAEGFSLGFWTDHETGRIWLDVSWGFTRQGAAIKAAEENGELSIWDVDQMLALDVRYG